ncbi:D-alanine--D-alanine ligase [Patescibacteria group bacterium]|nr:D-alanine--D-alanine ligase [Patescibacteria group bacterium]
MTKIKVAVLMGGKSDEREVSLVSGKSVMAGFDKKKYEVIPMEISADGKKWEIMDQKLIEDFLPTIGREATEESVALVGGSDKCLDLPQTGLETDVVFIALHGKNGEDGVIQGLLDYIGIPYTGCGVLASAIGMDKVVFKRLIEGLGVRTPRWWIYKEGEKYSVPCVVKPSCNGSSVGVSIVKRKKDFAKAIEMAKKYEDRILVEEYIKGIEVSCGVLGDEALPVIEIVPKNEFFDYEAKYTNDMCEEICPARISEKLTKEIQSLSLKIFRAIGGSGFGRVDMIIRDGVPYVLEINTIPGLTPNSLLPKEAKVAGYGFAKMLDKMVELALKKPLR